jgi:hypothetical protein
MPGLWRKVDQDVDVAVVLPETIKDLLIVHIQILQQKRGEKQRRAQVWRWPLDRSEDEGRPARPMCAWSVRTVCNPAGSGFQ